MSKNTWVCLFIGFLLPLALFQNCGSQFKANESQVSFSFCKVQGDQTKFASSKIHLDAPFFAAQQKVGFTERHYSIVLDVQCSLESDEPMEFLGQQLVLQDEHKRMQKAALTLAMPANPDLKAFELELDNNPCLLAVTENHDIKHTQSNQTFAVNDPQASNQAHLSFLQHSQSLALQSAINRPVVVAFIDTGVDYNHPDLQSRMWRDSSGRYGFNVLSQSYDPLDDDGHGTHVAGIVAAVENDGSGVAGLTGDYVQVMAIKVLDRSGEGTSQQVYNGIQYAITNGADIINLSVESQGRNTLMEDALRDAVNAGIVVTAATGNQSSEITNGDLYAPAYIGPGLAGVISVASVDTQGVRLSNFSNYSATYAEISAPGAENSANSNGGILSTELNGTSKRIRGTSQAAPMVTAAAAMLIGYLKTNGIAYTPKGIEDFLKSDGVMINTNLRPYVFGGGILNLGFLAQNLTSYFSNASAGDGSIFNGGETSGNSCTIP